MLTLSLFLRVDFKEGQESVHFRAKNSTFSNVTEEKYSNVPC